MRKTEKPLVVPMNDFVKAVLDKRRAVVENNGGQILPDKVVILNGITIVRGRIIASSHFCIKPIASKFSHLYGTQFSRTYVVKFYE